MTIMISLVEGNGIKSGVTLKQLVSEGWVRFEDMDLDYELDTNQLNDVIYESVKWSAYARRLPTSGYLYERIQSDSFTTYMKNGRK